METKHIKVTYIDHSGFLVELKEATLVFDYYTGTLPKLRAEKPLVVFASHAHSDHFQKRIFQWKETYPDTTYVLSEDIFKHVSEGTQALWVKPLQEVQAGPCTVQTLQSTDEGVAFLVKCGGVTVYHAGDLNWWHWEEEGEAYNAEMKRDYQREINRMEGETVHLAFVPTDRRLGEAYFWGLDYYMRHTDTQKVFPMHFWGEYEVCQDLLEQEETAEYREKIVTLHGCGEVFEWDVQLGG